MSLLSMFFSSGNKAAAGANDNWIVDKVTTSDGKTGVFRFIQTKPFSWNKAPLSEEVSISWNYKGDFPDEDANKMMNELEDALAPLSESKESCLVLVMTFSGLREWCYYTRDYDAFMKVLNNNLSGKPKFPISIVHSHDPEWKYWHSFVDKLDKN